MNVVILAGGYGTRLAEETEVVPKPMVKIGSQPLLWHILKLYSHYGFKDFVVALGYKSEVIKRYFLDLVELNGDMALSFREGRVERENGHAEDWNVRLIETGMDTITGGRLKRVGGLLRGETFMMTYGDGVADVDLQKLFAFHRAHGKLATVTAVRPPARFGGLEIEGSRVERFTEKPQIGEGWINGGFFVLEPAVLDYIDGDSIHWEREPLERLAAEGQLMAYRHDSFWQCMDNLRDKRLLESLWMRGGAPWKVWD